MQHGLVGVLGVTVIYVINVIAMGTKKDTEVAEALDAGAIALRAQKIPKLVMGQEVRDIAYYTWSKSHEMCTYFMLMSNY